MAVWPAIPFLDDPNSHRERGPQDNVLRTPFDKGPVKTRRRFTAAPKVISGRTDVMTDAQVATFETWFKNTIDDGAIEFTATHPRTGVTETFRFMETYEVIYLHTDINRIAMTLEQLP